MLHMEMCCCSYFQWCGYFWDPWVSFVTTDTFSVGVTRITSRTDVSWTHSLPFCFDLFLSSELWPYYQKDVNQATSNHKILQNLALQIFVAFAWILVNVNLSLSETLLTYLFYTRQTWMTQLILANVFL